MYSAICPCGRHIGLTDVNVCPFCKKDLTKMTDEYDRKHIRSCARSDIEIDYPRRKGRPKKVLEIETEIIPPFRRLCRNCGAFGCIGKDDSDTCDDWIIQSVSLCSCGRRPSEDWRNGCLYSIRCGWCNLTMDSFHDRHGTERLITMWNDRMKM